MKIMKILRRLRICFVVIINNLSNTCINNWGNSILENKYVNKYRANISCASLLAMIGTCICVVEHEIYILYGKNTSDNIRFNLLIANVICTFLLVLTIIYSYFIWMKYEQALGIRLTIERMSRSNFKSMCFEILINIISPYPFLMNITYKEYVYGVNLYIDKRIDTILICFMFAFRAYHIPRYLLYGSMYMSNRAVRVCRLYGHECELMFAAKSVFNQSALKIFPILYLAMVVAVGTLLHFNEQQAYNQIPKLSNFNWSNSFWCSIITMATVGYGDFSPRTDFGRAVGVCCTFIGVFLSSLSTVGLNKVLSFERGEWIAVRLIEFLDNK